MTVEEILACKIPEGKYALALKHLQESVSHFKLSTFYGAHENDELVTSLCAAFSALYELAQGKDENDMCFDAHQAGIKTGQDIAISNVLMAASRIAKLRKVVEMQTAVLKIFQWANAGCCVNCLNELAKGHANNCMYDGAIKAGDAALEDGKA